MTAPVIEFENDLANGEDAEHNGAYFLLHSNIKIFSKAIQALAKLGSDLYLEPSQHGLSLKSFNQSKCAYGVFLFSNDFFSEADYSPLAGKTNNKTLCRISMKCALSIFKGIQFLDKSFMSFKIWVDPGGDTLVVEIVHAYDLIRTLEINVRENKPPFKSTVDKNKLANMTIASADTFMSLLTLLRSQSEELVITAKEDEFIFKNYCSKDNQEELHKIVKTQANVRINDLNRHVVNHATEVTFSIRDFMAILSFAANHQSPVSLYYDNPGRPLVVALEGDVNYTSEFTIVTYVNSYSEADESGQLEVRTISQNGSRSRRSDAVQSEKRKVPTQSEARSTQLDNRQFLRNEHTNSVHQGPQPVTAPGSSAHNASLQNPYLTPVDSNLINSAERRSPSRVEPVDDIVFLDDAPPLDQHSYMENLGFEGFNTAVSQRDNPVEEPMRSRSPSPKRTRNNEFRRFFLNVEQSTQHPSQAFHDESVMAYDSFDEGFS